MDIMIIEGEPGKGTYRKLQPVPADMVTVIEDLDALFDELIVMDKVNGKNQKS